MKQGKSFIFYYLFYCIFPLLLYFQQLGNPSIANNIVIKIANKIQQQNSTIFPTSVSRRRFYQHIARLLGWVIAPKLLCKGFFKEPLMLIKNPYLSPSTDSVIKETTHISSQGLSTVTMKGISILQKNVVITQPGRIIKADKAYIYRNENGHLIKIIVVGHINLYEIGKHIIADKGTLTIYPNKTVILMNAIYHLYGDKSYFCKFKHSFDIWGTTKHAVISNASNRITLQHAMYSTCNPESPNWSISMTTLVLNEHSHRGEAYNVFFHIGRIPIFYFPYFNFPINNYRKTGFLVPYGGHSSNVGWFLFFLFIGIWHQITI